MSDQINFVDGAVIDLVHNYDSIIDKLPNVATKIKEMQINTESMAHSLELRMKNLIDGYEFLDTISAQVHTYIYTYMCIYMYTYTICIHAYVYIHMHILMIIYLYT
jgi:hypothetical protein